MAWPITLPVSQRFPFLKCWPPCTRKYSFEQHDKARQKSGCPVADSLANTSSAIRRLGAGGWDVTLFASRDSVTRAHLHAVVDKGYEEDSAVDPKVAEYLHISEAFERAAEFDLIHSHYDFMALTYTRLVKTPVLTTIHGFSSAKIMPVYQKYRDGYFVSISDSDRAAGLNYLATVYNGIDLSLYPLQEL